MVWNNIRNSHCWARFPTLSRFFIVAILCFLGPDVWSPNPSPSFFASAYRIGDTIETTVSTRSALTIDLLIANQPLFGVTKTVHLPRLPERFSLSFEEGLYTTPYVDAATTERLVVTFVHSKSGAGRIHSVTSKAVASPTKKRFDRSQEVEVLFDWVEEENVDLEAGAIVMFLVVFVVSILFVFQLCAIEQPDDPRDDGYDDRYGDQYGDHNSNSYYKGR